RLAASKEIITSAPAVASATGLPAKWAKRSLGTSMTIRPFSPSRSAPMPPLSAGVPWEPKPIASKKARARATSATGRLIQKSLGIRLLRSGGVGAFECGEVELLHGEEGLGHPVDARAVGVGHHRVHGLGHHLPRHPEAVLQPAA